MAAILVVEDNSNVRLELAEILLEGSALGHHPVAKALAAGIVPGDAAQAASPMRRSSSFAWRGVRNWCRRLVNLELHHIGDEANSSSGVPGLAACHGTRRGKRAATDVLTPDGDGVAVVRARGHRDREEVAIAVRVGQQRNA